MCDYFYTKVQYLKKEKKISSIQFNYTHLRIDIDVIITSTFRVKGKISYNLKSKLTKLACHKNRLTENTLRNANPYF